MAIYVAAGLFAVFSVNVLLGAISGSAFLNDIGEMLVLFAASIAFVVGILAREKAAKTNQSKLTKREE